MAEGDRAAAGDQGRERGAGLADQGGDSADGDGNVAFDRGAAALLRLGELLAQAPDGLALRFGFGERGVRNLAGIQGGFEDGLHQLAQAGALAGG